MRNHTYTPIQNQTLVLARKSFKVAVRESNPDPVRVLGFFSVVVDVPMQFGQDVFVQYLPQDRY